MTTLELRDIDVTLATPPPALHIIVTPEDIDNGIGSQADACPIALAVLRGYTYVDRVEVEDDLRLYIGRTWYIYTLPLEADEFIQTFDAGDDPVEPFAFFAHGGEPVRFSESVSALALDA